jgi:hypothetical protein
MEPTPDRLILVSIMRLRSGADVPIAGRWIVTGDTIRGLLAR